MQYKIPHSYVNKQIYGESKNFVSLVVYNKTFRRRRINYLLGILLDNH